MVKNFFYLKTDKKNANSENAIYCKISYRNTSATFSTGKYISKIRWSETDHLRRTLRNKNEKSLKVFLDRLSNKIEEIYLNFPEKNNILSAKTIKDLLKGKKPTQNVITFTKLVESHNTHFNKRVTAGERSNATLQKYKRASSLFIKFLKHKYGLDDIDIEKINMKLIFDFENYMRYDCKYKGNYSIGNNSAVKYIKRLSTIFFFAIKRELVQVNPFSNHDGKIQEPVAQFLTIKELRSIETKVLTISRLDRVKDIFLFSCYTGYAPADVNSLTHQHLIKDNEGTLWINTHRTKSKIQSNVPLLKPALEIIEKYKDLNSEYLLPTLSSQKMNAYLKEIADLCGIKKHLTHYVARHTFATTVTLGYGVKIENVSAMMGHTNLQRTRHYAKVMDSNVKNDMAKISSQFV